MTWAFILLDVILLAAVTFLICVLVRLWTKRKGLHIDSLSRFRNDDLYEKSIQDKKKLAHIEEIVESEEYIGELSVDELLEDGISGADISFSDGYGRTTGGEEYDDED